MQPIHIVIGQAAEQPAAQEAMSPGAYAGVAPEIQEEAQIFVVAVDGAGEAHRLASVCEHDRHIVAALTGTWLAEGYRVNTIVGLKELIRVLRKSARIEKEATQDGPEKNAILPRPEQAPGNGTATGGELAW